MKAFSFIAPLILFSIISSLNLYLQNDQNAAGNRPSALSTTASILNDNIPEIMSAKYVVKAGLDDQAKSLSVAASIEILSAKAEIADTLFLLMGLNDVITNSVMNESISQRIITFKDYEFEDIRINGKSANFRFYNSELQDLPDSSIGYVDIGNFGAAGDTMVLSLVYKVKLRNDLPSPGYSTGRDFYYVSSWLPRIISASKSSSGDGPFIDGLFNVSNSSDYEIELTLPENYRLINSAQFSDSAKVNGNYRYRLISNDAPGVSWIAAKEIEQFSFEVDISNNQSIKLNLFIQPENERYLERYREAAEQTLKYFDSSFGEFPYESINMVDIPQTSNSDFLAAENLITIKSEILSTKGLAEIEFYAAKMIGRQFFKSAMNLSGSVNHWIVEGLSSVYATEIVNTFFEPPKLAFKFASHYPVYGMNHLSFNDIPVVYSLIELEYDLAIRNITKYYSDVTMGSISECFFHYPDLNSFRSNKHIKPYLLFKSLIEKVGIENFNKSIKEMVFNVSSEHENRVSKFIMFLNEHSTTSVEQFIYKPVFVDYAVRLIEKVDENKYKVIAERKGDAVCAAKIILHTDGNSIEAIWNGGERFKQFIFTTDEEVSAAEIVLSDAKYLDINFANNSSTLDNQYWGSLSLAIRVFFWFQNAIMIFGSAS